MFNSHSPWIHSLSPYVFEVKNLSFESLTSPAFFIFITILVMLYFLFNFLVKKNLNKKALFEKLFIYYKQILVYLVLFLSVLIALKFLSINWGLRWYSLMYLLAFLIGYLGFVYHSKKKQLLLDHQEITTLLSCIMIGMILGARLGYVFIYDWARMKNDLWHIFAVWEGGLSFHGGIIGVMVAATLFSRRHKVSFFHIFDKAAIYVPLGIALGRLGNFINGELWGRVATKSIAWAVVFPQAGYLPRHPSQIYQSLCEGLLLFFLLFSLSRVPQRLGTLSSFFVMFYCIFRFFIEYFRAADEQLSYLHLKGFYWGPVSSVQSVFSVLTMGQILCGAFLLFGLGLFFWSRRNPVEYTKSWYKAVSWKSRA
jgi:phosphatidylglycerol:prolipoprotein diacylglycerol transferase